MAQKQATVSDPDPTRWIRYSQTYFKIPIAENGIYRITTVELQQAGISTDQLNPATVQLFHRGVEQAIYVAGETDGRFDTGDFIEFYGRRNDGAPDSLLYRPTSAQPHAYYSLFNDTTAYFLTWRLDGLPGRRMSGYTDTTYADLTPDAYHWADELRLFTENYPGWAAGIPPKIEYSYYEAGEGYTGSMQQKAKPYTMSFMLTDAVRSGPSPKIDLLLAGREFTNHRVTCLAGAASGSQHPLDSVRFSVYDNARIQTGISWSDVGTNGQLLVSTVSTGEASATDAYSVSYVRLRYPQRFTVNGLMMQTFQLAPNPVGRSLIELTAVPANTRFWNISDPSAPQLIGATQRSGTARLIVHGTDIARTLLSVNTPKSVAAIRPVRFTDWTARKPTYLIISHERLMRPVGTVNAVQEYARYRASAAGGSHDTLTVTMQQLIDQYSYGERHPLAIRRFLDQLLRQSRGSLQYLLLVGRGRSTPGIRRDPAQATLDLVMTAGFPGSDLLFSAGLNGQPVDVPAVPTGRINASSPEEVLHYLAKVKEYESLPPSALWRKNLLHLSGGETPDERSLFRQLVDDYRNLAAAPALGAQVTTLAKTTDKPVEAIDVVKSVNEGIGLITFFGHSGLDVTDLDIGFCSNDALGYQNVGKYPLLLVNGCAIGNFFYGRPTLSTDWVLTPNRGAIAALAHSHLGYPDVLHQYSTVLYNLLADSSQLAKSIGHLQQETIRRLLAQSSDGRVLANCQQMVLQGDPAIRLFPFSTPDYGLTAGGVSIQSADNQPLTIQSDSVMIRAVVQNAGQYRTDPLPVRVRRFVNGHESGVFNPVFVKSVAYSDTLTLTVPNQSEADGQNQFEVTVNPVDSPDTQPEINHTNNQVTVELILASPKPVLIYPAPGSVVTTRSVRLTAQYASRIVHPFDLELDSTARFDSPIRWKQRVEGSPVVSYQTTLPERPSTTYYWRIRLADSVNSATTWVTGFFRYEPGSAEKGLPEGQIRLAADLPSDLRQGDILRLPIDFANLSPYPFADSLVVWQTLYAEGLTNPQVKQWRLKAPAGSDTVRFFTQIPTTALPGLNRLLLTVNPRLQPEYSFLNNTLDLLLPVQPDLFGPILEVAFDGARITDDAVVSAQPVIDILVADDNRSLVRRDTTGLALYLQRPGRTASYERLNWRGATMQAGIDNVFRVRYPAPILSEGTYQLLITAQDAIGNAAAPYQVRFQVVRQRQLADLLVSPNPSRSEFRFSFTLTGDRPPEALTITLTDLNGRVIRHLKQSVRIGQNVWTWDGRTDAGEFAPAGAYIYQLTIEDGETWGISGKRPERLSGRIIRLP
ncbi:hypothetical protein GCM10028773_10720 [Spirosoma koreense]